jgi:hypothetical protein
METSLHRQLKELYAGENARVEVRLDGFRIDVLRGDELVEIQHGSLSAIRRKVARLLEDHAVRVVKPIVAQRRLIVRRRRGGAVDYRRLSPKHGTLCHVFDELIYFKGLFPHPRLVLDVVLVEIEEWRYPAMHRRRWRRRGFRMEDQHLLSVSGIHSFRTEADLVALLPASLPAPFHTGHLSEALHMPRHLAQRMAYCLLHAGALRMVGKQGNSRLYEPTQEVRAAAA